MSRIAYVNGRYLPHSGAAVHVEDRGYQFADGVYEVCEVRGGRLVDERRHMARLKRSLGELSIGWPMAPAALAVVMREVVRRNRIGEGLIYLQVTRGASRRNHAFPGAGVAPAVVVTTLPVDLAALARRAETGVSVITVPDNRWARVDIKSTSLLPNVLAKQKARESGAYEAWFVDAAGFVTEGSSTNAWIVTADGTIVTRSAEAGILRGITRTGVLDIAVGEAYPIEERSFSVAEAQAASEAFVTSASSKVTAVVRIDGVVIGNGRPGPVAIRLRQLFRERAEISPLWANGA